MVAPGAAPAARAKCSRFETVLTLFVNGHGPLLYCLSRLGYFFVSTSKRIDYCNVGSRIFVLTTIQQLLGKESRQWSNIASFTERVATLDKRSAAICFGL